MSSEASEAAVVTFQDAASFDAWLAEHASLQAGVWMKMEWVEGACGARVM